MVTCGACNVIGQWQQTVYRGVYEHVKRERTHGSFTEHMYHAQSQVMHAEQDIANTARTSMRGGSLFLSDSKHFDVAFTVPRLDLDVCIGEEYTVFYY